MLLKTPTNRTCLAISSTLLQILEPPCKRVDKKAKQDAQCNYRATFVKSFVLNPFAVIKIMPSPEPAEPGRELPRVCGP